MGVFMYDSLTIRDRIFIEAEYELSGLAIVIVPFSNPIVNFYLLQLLMLRNMGITSSFANNHKEQALHTNRA